jgi:hypothetical protein
VIYIPALHAKIQIESQVNVHANLVFLQKEMKIYVRLVLKIVKCVKQGPNVLYALMVYLDKHLHASVQMDIMKL